MILFSVQVPIKLRHALSRCERKLPRCLTILLQSLQRYVTLCLSLRLLHARKLHLLPLTRMYCCIRTQLRIILSQVTGTLYRWDSQSIHLAHHGKTSSLVIEHACQFAAVGAAYWFAHSAFRTRCRCTHTPIITCGCKARHWHAIHVRAPQTLSKHLGEGTAAVRQWRDVERRYGWRWRWGPRLQRMLAIGFPCTSVRCISPVMHHHLLSHSSDQVSNKFE